MCVTGDQEGGPTSWPGKHRLQCVNEQHGRQHVGTEGRVPCCYHLLEVTLDSRCGRARVSNNHVNVAALSLDNLADPPYVAGLREVSSQP